MAEEKMTAAETFLKYDYGETKDLLKTFITLISATLVLSLTFSEKVIDVAHTSATIANILLGSWALFILALICAGLGMCFIAAAAGKILYGWLPLFNLSYWRLAVTSWLFVLVAGSSYVVGLIALIVATAWSIGAP